MLETELKIQGVPRDIFSVAALKQELQELIEMFLENARVEEVEGIKWT